MDNFNNLVRTYQEWLDVQGIYHNDEVSFTDEQEKEFALVSRILATEQAIYMFRRTCGENRIDGSITDAMRSLFVKCKNEYEEIMGKEYVDVNVDVDF